MAWLNARDRFRMGRPLAVVLIGGQNAVLQCRIVELLAMASMSSKSIGTEKVRL